MNLIPFTAILDTEFIKYAYDDNGTQFNVAGYCLLINGKTAGKVSKLYNQHIMIDETIKTIDEPYRIVYHGNFSNNVISLAIVGNSYETVT